MILVSLEIVRLSQRTRKHKTIGVMLPIMITVSFIFDQTHLVKLYHLYIMHTASNFNFKSAPKMICESNNAKMLPFSYFWLGQIQFEVTGTDHSGSLSFSS